MAPINRDVLNSTLPKRPDVTSEQVEANQHLVQGIRIAPDAPDFGQAERRNLGTVILPENEERHNFWVPSTRLLRSEGLLGPLSVATAEST